MDNSNPGRYLKEKRAGRLMETREQQAEKARAPDRRQLFGRLESLPVNAQSKKLDEGDVTPSVDAGILSGVIAATVSTNRVMPLAASPSRWDVLACYHAIIDGSFTGFSLPAVGIKLGQYATGLMDVDFEDEDFDLDPPKQNIMNTRENDSYALRGLARCDQAGLTALIEASDTKVDVMALDWAGPWASEEIHFMSVELEDHVIGGIRYRHLPEEGNLTVTVPPVDVVEDNDHALIDIQFLTIEGQKWQAFMTRIR
ncbi:hypothetical protein C8N30_2673 [Sulfitobacter guttiformis]|uniref:Uncharacterized protein n=2 Tax=Sulfitobacter guttiformis TaxID=74349 RepID=A0A420DH97_9RHOB|nr:hypothetical protein C8N30_2673 [Sulfitobacter guttiformis]